jgi:ABC transporter
MTAAAVAVRDTPGKASPSGLVVDSVSRWGVGPVSFTAAPGTFVAITGRHGAGKSSIIGVVAGFDKPDGGRVLLDGDNVHTMPRERLESRVGWLGGVIPKPGRARRTIPALVVGDDPEAPIVIEQEFITFAAYGPTAEERRLNERLVPLLATIRFLCDQGAIVVVGTRHRVLVRAADRVVRL